MSMIFASLWSACLINLSNQVVKWNNIWRLWLKQGCGYNQRSCMNESFKHRRHGRHSRVFEINLQFKWNSPRHQRVLLVSWEAMCARAQLSSYWAPFSSTSSGAQPLGRVPACGRSPVLRHAPSHASGRPSSRWRGMSWKSNTNKILHFFLKWVALL